MRMSCKWSAITGALNLLCRWQKYIFTDIKINNCLLKSWASTAWRPDLTRDLCYWSPQRGRSMMPPQPFLSIWRPANKEHIFVWVKSIVCKSENYCCFLLMPFLFNNSAIQMRWRDLISAIWKTLLKPICSNAVEDVSYWYNGHGKCSETWITYILSCGLLMMTWDLTLACVKWLWLGGT